MGYCNYLGCGARVAPPGQKSSARLCTNPLLFSFPVENNPPFVLDMSTTIAAEGKVAQAHIKGAGLPPGILINQSQEVVSQPGDLYQPDNSATLAPLGFPLAGYKGYGLAVFIEALVGILGGANFAIDVGVEGNGLLIMALNPRFFQNAINPAALGANLVDFCYSPQNQQDIFRYPGMSNANDNKDIWAHELSIHETIYNKIIYS
jgi:L-lactate dehydrogenase/uncharacterized oxidoreductase